MAVRGRAARLTFLSCPARTSSSGNPASGTSLVSNPRAVPTNRTSAPCVSRSSRAIASAGITCPPVPPPAIKTRSATTSVDLTRHIHQHAHPSKRNKDRSPPRRDERQRNPLGRQQRQHHAHIEEGLNQNCRRQSKRQEPRKRIGRQKSRPQPAIPQSHEQRDNNQRPNQTQLLADVREDK